MCFENGCHEPVPIDASKSRRAVNREARERGFFPPLFAETDASISTCIAGVDCHTPSVYSGYRNVSGGLLEEEINSLLNFSCRRTAEPKHRT